MGEEVGGKKEEEEEGGEGERERERYLKALLVDLVDKRQVHLVVPLVDLTFFEKKPRFGDKLRKGTEEGNCAVAPPKVPAASSRHRQRQYGHRSDPTKAGGIQADRRRAIQMKNRSVFHHRNEVLFHGARVHDQGGRSSTHL